MSKIDRLQNNYNYFRGLTRYILLPMEKRILIKKNSLFMNAHKNERCFILGNGPSTNSQDLSKLHDETVFCVNEFVRNKDIQIVNPDYYVLADPKFFDMKSDNKGDMELINKFQIAFQSFPELKLFVPIEAREVIQKYKWTVNTYYYFSGVPFEKFQCKKIDLSKTIPSMQAVVQYAILIAIYMGFKEIYLLGTEQTNIFGNIKAYIEKNAASEYSFEMNEEEKKWKNKKLTSYSLSETLRGYARIFELYSELYIYCKSMGIGLYNCAPETLIQDISKVNYEDLF